MVESEEAVHEFAEHVAAVNVPKEHELDPDTVYPELHVGWHVEPLARELVQSPTLPFDGAVDASHGFAVLIAIICPTGKWKNVESTNMINTRSQIQRKPYASGHDVNMKTQVQQK